MAKAKPKPQEPVFSRGDVAKILNCSPLTIANREAAGKYPAPQRDLNNYRIYTLADVVNLQFLTYDMPDSRPILAVLWNKGYQETKDLRHLGELYDRVLRRRSGATHG